MQIRPALEAFRVPGKGDPPRLENLRMAFCSEKILFLVYIYIYNTGEHVAKFLNDFETRLLC